MKKQFRSIAVVIMVAVLLSLLVVPVLAAAAVSVRVTETTFSPNGDGFRDTTEVHWAQSQVGNVTARVLQGGRVVSNLGVWNNLSSGRHAFIWAGTTRYNGGTRLPDGRYTVQVLVTNASGTGSAATDLVINKSLIGPGSIENGAITKDKIAAGAIQGYHLNVGGGLIIPNLNADTVDGKHASNFDTADAANAATGAANAAANATNATDIATNATDIATNGTAIATNATDIATNATDIATNAADIATNAAASNAADIALGLRIDSAESSITANRAAITANANNIAANDTSISVNAANIASNDTDIAARATIVAVNAADTALGLRIDSTESTQTNFNTRITSLETSSTDYNGRIGTNESDIATNAAAIASNTAAIAANTAAIAANTAAIASNESSITINKTLLRNRLDTSSLGADSRIVAGVATATVGTAGTKFKSIGLSPSFGAPPLVFVNTLSLGPDYVGTSISDVVGFASESTLTIVFKVNDPSASLTDEAIFTWIALGS